MSHSRYNQDKRGARFTWCSSLRCIAPLERHSGGGSVRAVRICREAGSVCPPQAGCPNALASGRGVVIGSAWRWAIFHASPSRRKIIVTRNEYGTGSGLPSM
jgi:hypothetical protein